MSAPFRLISDKERIVVRYSSGTHIARYKGKTASCTSDYAAAAKAVAAKVLRHTKHLIKLEVNKDFVQEFRVYTWKAIR
jgi:hypothetical protein